MRLFFDTFVTYVWRDLPPRSLVTFVAILGGEIWRVGAIKVTDGSSDVMSVTHWTPAAELAELPNLHPHLATHCVVHLYHQSTCSLYIHQYQCTFTSTWTALLCLYESVLIQPSCFPASSFFKLSKCLKSLKMIPLTCTSLFRSCMNVSCNLDYLPFIRNVKTWRSSLLRFIVLQIPTILRFFPLVGWLGSFTEWFTASL